MKKTYDATTYMRDDKGNWVESDLTCVVTLDPKEKIAQMRKRKKEGVFSRILISDENRLVAYTRSGEYKHEYICLEEGGEEDEN